MPTAKGEGKHASSSSPSSPPSSSSDHPRDARAADAERTGAERRTDGHFDSEGTGANATPHSPVLSSSARLLPSARRFSAAAGATRVSMSLLDAEATHRCQLRSPPSSAAAASASAVLSTPAACATGGHRAKAKRTIVIDGFEWSEDDDEDDMGNGCGEGVSRYSSEDDGAEEDVVVTSAAAERKAATATAKPTEVSRPSAFSAAAMRAMRARNDHTDTAAAIAVGAVSSSTTPNRTEVKRPHTVEGSDGGQDRASGDDGSAVLSGLQMLMQQHEECARLTETTGKDSFLDQFAPLYEIAIFEIIMECERRVAHVTPVDRDVQVERLRGRNNGALAVSAHCFDSPVSQQQSAFPSLAKPLSGTTASALMLGSATGGARSSSACPGPFGTSSPKQRGAHARTVSLSFSCSYASSPTGAKVLLPPPSQQQPHMCDETPISQGASAPFPAVRRFSSFAHTGVATAAPAPAGKLECLPPAESVQRLLCALDREMRYQESAPLVFMAALAYLSRFAARCTSSHGSVTSANWFRLTLISILTASKMYNEYGSRKVNRLFADIAGVALWEVNRLELDFLYLLDFELLLKEADIEGWVQWMEALALRHNMFTPLQTFMMGNSSEKETNKGDDDDDDDDGDASTALVAASFVSVAPSQPVSELLPSSHCLAAAEAGGSRLGGALPAPVSAQGVCHRTTEGGVASVSYNSPFLGTPATPLQRHAATASAASSQATAEGGAVAPAGEAARLFSVVHAPAEPRTPPTIRELSRLGATPPSPLAPPVMTPSASPVAFFKRRSSNAGGSSSLAGRSHGYTSSVANVTSHHRGDPSSMASSMQPLTPRHGTDAAEDPLKTRGGNANSACGAEAAVASSSASAVGLPHSAKDAARRVGGASGAIVASATWRGDGLNVMQRAREALNVAASLVRGQLNVMRADKLGYELQGSASARITSPSTPLQQHTGSGADKKSSHTSRSAVRPVTSVDATDMPVARGTSGAISPGGRTSLYPATTAPTAGEETGVCDEDDDEEGEEGYWDDYGYYHYYDDEEGYYDEEGNYYTYAEDERIAAAQGYRYADEAAAAWYAEGSAAYHGGAGATAWDVAEDDADAFGDGSESEEPEMFRPPPRTHSPPTL